MGFFKREDKVQMRYEMLREAETTDKTIEETAEKYGYSRARYYIYRRRYEEEGMLGLQDRKRGPKEPHKVKGELWEKIVELRSEGKNIYRITGELKEMGHDISAKSVERVVNAEGMRLKKNGSRKGRKRGMTTAF